MAILEALGLDDETDPVQWCADLGIPEDDLGVMADEAHGFRRLRDNNSRDMILAISRAAY